MDQMTGAHTVLRCPDCEVNLPFPQLGICIYAPASLELEPGGEYRWWRIPDVIPVLRQRCWCVDCNGPSYAERIPCEAEFMAATTLLRRQEDAKRRKIEPPPLEVHDELLERPLAQVVDLYRHFAQRKQPGLCLNCGSADWLAIQLGDGSLRPRLLHDPCGTPLVWTGFSIGPFCGTMPLRAYAFETGRLIEEALTR